MSIQLMMRFNHLIVCCPFLFLPSIIPSIRVFSNESILHIRWPNYWSFSSSSFNEYSGLISFNVQFSSVIQSCLTLCNPMNCNTPGLPVHHQLPELVQINVHQVGDAIQPSRPLSSPSPAFNLSQQQSFPVSQFFASAG